MTAAPAPCVAPRGISMAPLIRTRKICVGREPEPGTAARWVAPPAPDPLPPHPPAQIPTTAVPVRIFERIAGKSEFVT